MKKKILSFVLMMAVLLCAVPFVQPAQVQAKAMSNAEALAPFPYQTGSYITLRSLTVYSNASGSGYTGQSVAKNKTVSVKAVSGHYGKVTVNNKTGWIDLSYAYSTQNQFDIPARLNMLRKKFPDGMYWNRATAGVNNANGYTDQPCPSGHTDGRDNYFDGTCQCHGFALKLGYDLFGIHADCWQRHYDVSKVVVGDLIRYRNRHTVMVTGVYSDYFTVADCNYDYSCGISWDHAMGKDGFSFIDSPYDGVYHCPSNNVGNHKHVLTTTLSSDAACGALLLAGEDMWYFADGVTSGGKTTFTFCAPAGIYEDLMIINENDEEYSYGKAFVLGKSKLPASISLKTYVEIDDDDRWSYDLSFTRQPQSVRAASGDSVKFTAEAESEYGVDISYQWFYRKAGEKRWTLWKGQTGKSLYATANDSWQGMEVCCGAVDSWDDYVFSDAAKITLTESLKITSHPSNVTVKVDGSVSFAVKAKGNGLRYQWYYKKAGQTAWNVWKGRTTATTIATANATWEGMQVYCKVTDENGKSQNSNAAKITVTQDLKITQQPVNQSVKLGGTVNLSVKAQGMGLKYQWYYKKAGQTAWSKWNGHTAASASVVPNESWNGIKLYCVVKDASGKTENSSIVIITVTQDLKVIQHPKNVTTKTNQKVVFTVKAQGIGLKYQWYYKKKGAKNWSKWNGQTATGVAATANSTWNGMKVYCKITDATGKSVNSGSATVTIR